MLRKITMASLGLALLASVASADTTSVFQSANASEGTPGVRFVLPLDDSWTVLDEFMNEGDFFPSNPWTYSSAVPVTFTITDLFVVSDQFEIWLDGAYFATTPAVPDWPAYTSDPFDPAYWTNDPDVALASGYFSSGVYALPAGTHDVWIRDIHIPPQFVGGPPFGDGTVAFKAVPEPTSLALLALAGIAAFRRR